MFGEEEGPMVILMDDAFTKEDVIFCNKGFADKTVLGCNRNDHIIEEETLDCCLVFSKGMLLEFLVVGLVCRAFDKGGLNHIDFAVLVKTGKECFYAVGGDGIIRIKEEEIFTVGGMDTGIAGGGEALVLGMMEDTEGDGAAIGFHKLFCQIHAAVGATIIYQDALNAVSHCLGSDGLEATKDIRLNVVYGDDDGYFHFK